MTCTWSEPSVPLPPYELLEVAIEVEVAAGAATGANEVQVSGGEGFTTAPDGVTRRARLAYASADGRGATPFGVEEYTLQNEDEGGSFDTQAGSHPFQQTTNIAFNQGAPKGKGSSIIATAPALAKDLHFHWPAGLIGNPLPFPQCTETQFTTEFSGGADLCDRTRPSVWPP